ncbi:unnamed protein product, partial [Brachionus calyciflorus]
NKNSDKTPNDSASTDNEDDNCEDNSDDKN